MSGSRVVPVLAPPPYEKAINDRGSKAFDGRLKIIVGLDFGTTNSGKRSQFCCEAAEGS